MSEIIFPLLGSAFVMLAVLPAFALVAKLALVILERDEMSGPFHGLGARYLVLAGSSVLPLAWFVSAGMHQAESGTSVLACLFDHETSARCFEPGLFVLTMFLVMFGLCLSRLRQQAGCKRKGGSAELQRRLDRIVETHPMLQRLHRRVHASGTPALSIGASGLVRPAVYVGAGFAERLSDDALASALGHELEHVRSFDPLRFLVLDLALALNPFGRLLLEPHAVRWFGAREAHCDRAAVVRGAAPLPLAEAIVQAARPASPSVIGLGARDATMLEFRVSMLFAYAEQRPSPCCRHEPSAMPFALVLLLITLLLPHQTSTFALDALHAGSEHALAHFWR
jgi:Zn-dependent protease with chaperone function